MYLDINYPCKRELGAIMTYKRLRIWLSAVTSIFCFVGGTLIHGSELYVTEFVSSITPRAEYEILSAVAIDIENTGTLRDETLLAARTLFMSLSSGERVRKADPELIVAFRRIFEILKKRPASDDEETWPLYRLFNEPIIPFFNKSTLSNARKIEKLNSYQLMWWSIQIVCALWIDSTEIIADQSTLYAFCTYIDEYIKNNDFMRAYTLDWSFYLLSAFALYYDWMEKKVNTQSMKYILKIYPYIFQRVTVGGYFVRLLMASPYAALEDARVLAALLIYSYDETRGLRNSTLAGLKSPAPEVQAYIWPKIAARKENSDEPSFIQPLAKALKEFVSFIQEKPYSIPDSDIFRTTYFGFLANTGFIEDLIRDKNPAHTFSITYYAYPNIALVGNSTSYMAWHILEFRKKYWDTLFDLSSNNKTPIDTIRSMWMHAAVGDPVALFNAAALYYIRFSNKPMPIELINSFNESLHNNDDFFKSIYLPSHTLAPQESRPVQASTKRTKEAILTEKVGYKTLCTMRDYQQTRCENSNTSIQESLPATLTEHTLKQAYAARAYNPERAPATVSNVIEREEIGNTDDRISFYHGQSRDIGFIGELFLALQRGKYISKELPVEPSFLRIYEPTGKPLAQLLVDWKESTRKDRKEGGRHLFFTNISLFGNWRRYGAYTWNYFISGSSAASPELIKLMRQMGLDSAETSKAEALLRRYAQLLGNHGQLLQIQAKRPWVIKNVLTGGAYGYVQKNVFGGEYKNPADVYNLVMADPQKLVDELGTTYEFIMPIYPGKKTLVSPVSDNVIVYRYNNIDETSPEFKNFETNFNVFISEVLYRRIAERVKKDGPALLRFYQAGIDRDKKTISEMAKTLTDKQVPWYEFLRVLKGSQYYTPEMWGIYNVIRDQTGKLALALPQSPDARIPSRL